MNFILVRDALIALLVADGLESGYRVLGHKGPAQSALGLTGENNLVQVCLAGAKFPRDKSSGTSVLYHDLKFAINITVAAKASADVAVLDNPESTPLQLQTALLGVKSAESRIDLALDALYAKICTVLYNALNIDLDLEEELMSRWLNDYEKGVPTYHGALCTLDGTLQFTCGIDETFTGDLGQPLIGFDIELRTGEDEYDPNIAITTN